MTPQSESAYIAYRGAREKTRAPREVRGAVPRGAARRPPRPAPAHPAASRGTVGPYTASLPRRTIRLYAAFSRVNSPRFSGPTPRVSPRARRSDFVFDFSPVIAF